jgi:hypothetical protein
MHLKRALSANSASTAQIESFKLVERRLLFGFAVRLSGSQLFRRAPEQRLNQRQFANRAIVDKSRVPCCANAVGQFAGNPAKEGSQRRALSVDR